MADIKAQTPLLVAVKNKHIQCVKVQRLFFHECKLNVHAWSKVKAILRGNKINSFFSSMGQRCTHKCNGCRISKYAHFLAPSQPIWLRAIAIPHTVRPSVCPSVNIWGTVVCPRHFYMKPLSEGSENSERIYIADVQRRGFSLIDQN